MIIHWIWLATRSGIGDSKKRQLVEQFGDPGNIYDAREGSLKYIEGLSENGKDSLMDKDLGICEKILEQCTQKGIRILTYQDAAYPERLRQISDPPMVLYYVGTLPEFDAMPLIGVVGTRGATAYGLTSAKRLGYQIAACGGGVISGLAYGVDGMAMKGALSAGGTVIGILGCGADVVYPESNRALYADTARYGCILTEFPPGTAPIGRNFPRRNRLISGLSCGVLVVEAPEGSGALITARLALDQNRDVFAIPSNIDNPVGRGSNQLLRSGAIQVETGWDVMREYVAIFPDQIRREGLDARMDAYPDEVAFVREATEKRTMRVAQKRSYPTPKTAKKPEETKKGIDNPASRPYIDLNEIESSLSQEEKAIVAQLTGGQKLVDEIIADSGLSAGGVLASLTLLEVKGIIRRLPGKYIALAGSK